MISTADLSTAWREVHDHDRWRFELPDPIGFADAGPDGRDWVGGPWAAEGRMHRPATISRPDGRERALCVLDPGVHAAYRAAVARVAPAIERALGPSVLAARCLGQVAGLRLEPWRPAWRRHARAVARLGRSAGPVLRMDVRDFYGSLALEPLCQALSRVRAERDDVAQVRDLLLGFEADGIRGLPVGPEPSAVLANLALVEADRVLARLGLPFVRWCDDVTIGLGRTDPRVAAEAWEAALAGVGLRPAPEKTRVLEPGERFLASGGAIARFGRRPPSGERSTRRGPAGEGATGPQRSDANPPSVGPDALERAASLADEPDVHTARAIVAAVALAGGRRAHLALRHVRMRFPENRAAAGWGLSR